MTSPGIAPLQRRRSGEPAEGRWCGAKSGSVMELGSCGEGTASLMASPVWSRTHHGLLGGGVGHRAGKSGHVREQSFGRERPSQKSFRKGAGG
ncbi:hypothetical protein M758_1G051900 [Ceratodon purpureus]|nr:hypothetical protein M758_1G051900 [Ceratodon purpureus]